MSTQYETGHAINVANCEEIIIICSALGNTYNPAKPSISISALNAIYAQGREALEDVSNKFNACSLAINNRKEIFEDVKTLGTRLLNYLYVTDASEGTIDNAKTINRKIQGKRASKKTTETINPEGTTNETPKSVSTSQQSYDQLIEHFYKFISLLETIPSYTPNEVELKIPTLKAKLDAMRAANTAIIHANIDLQNSRIARDKILYNENTGIYDLMSDVKKYIKSVFGVNSTQHRQVSGILFKKVKTR